MAVITISRQVGSYGDEIAEEVADALAFRVVDRELLSEETGIVVMNPDLERVFGRHRAVEDRVEHLHTVGDYLRTLAAAINDLARRGQAVDRPDAVHVRIVAPTAARVAYLIHRGQLPEEDAERYLRESDERRAAFHRELYGAEWDDPDLYDLTINSARSEREGAAAAILALVKTRGLVSPLEAAGSQPRY